MNESNLPERKLPFGSVLKSYRKRSRLTQQDLADAMNVTRNTVINWEAGKSRPDYELVPDLCGVLYIPLCELFGIASDGSLSELEKRIVNNLRQLSKPNRIAFDTRGQDDVISICAVLQSNVKNTDDMEDASDAKNPNAVQADF